MKTLKKQLLLNKFPVRCFLLIILFLALASPGQGQSRIAERIANTKVIFNGALTTANTAVLKPSTAHSGWIAVGAYQTFTVYVEFDTTGILARGLTSVDSVEISMEQWGLTTQPGSSSTGFLEKEAIGTVAIREVIALYDSTTIFATPKTFISFHGSGDPEIALATYVRFYRRVVGGFTGAGLNLTYTFIRQP